VRFFPRMWVQRVGLDGGAPQHLGGCGGVQPGLEALPEGGERLARQSQLAGEAGRRLPLGTPPQPPHQGRWRLTGRGEDGTGQQGVIASAPPAPVGRTVALYTEAPAIWAPAVRALPAPWVEVAFQPEGTAVIVPQVGYGESAQTVI
jgi:hypothetical protein